MIALVTGGAGFIGSHLCSALLRRGDHVRALDNLVNGSRENLEALLHDAGVPADAAQRLEFVEADIRDRAAVSAAMKDCRTVFHLGALGSVPRSVNDPWTSHDVNVNGTVVVLEAAREVGIERLVFSSSSSVYGNTPTLPKPEDMPLRPMSPYAVTKLAG